MKRLRAILVVPVFILSTAVLAEEIELIAFEQINAFRTANNLPKLEYDECLTFDASSWSNTMTKTGFRHGCHYRENIATNTLKGVASALRVFEQWRDSPGHRRLLLSPTLTSAGLGAAEKNGETYWTFRGNTGLSYSGTPQQVRRGLFRRR